MLMNLHKTKWTDGLEVSKFEEHDAKNSAVIKEMAMLAELYNERVTQEEKKTPEEVAVDNVGKVDPKKRLHNAVTELATSNISHCLATMLDSIVF